MKPAYRLAHGTFSLLGKLFFDYRVYNRENLIQHGPALIVSNHVSFVDPPLVGIAFSTDIHYMARKTLFDHPVTNWLYPKWNAFPVDQKRPDMSSMKRVLRLLKQRQRVLIFPEGRRSFDGTLGAAQPGVGLTIAKSTAPVLPVRLFGAEKALPRGSKRLRSTRVCLVVGEAIELTNERRAAKGREAYQNLADSALQAIAKIRPPADWRG